MAEQTNKSEISPPSGLPVHREFLAECTLRKIALPSGCPFTLLGLAIGKGTTALEVLAVESSVEPNLPEVRSVWKARQGGRAAPLILAVLHDGKATLCGPSGDEPATYSHVERGQAERICREALEKPDRHAALRWLRDALPSMDSRLPGIRNEGFLASHELAVGARRLDAWADAERKARPALQNHGDALLRSLGFNIEPVDQVTSILRAGDNARKVAVAVLLRQDESAELSAPRFSGMSPVSYALAVADRENIPYVLISQGSKIRLYPAKVGVGVGRRGRSETYIEIHTGLLRDSDTAFLWLLFSAEALTEGGSLQTLLEESNRFAGDLADRLRDRIYGAVIPRLAEGLAKERGLRKPTAKDLAETYQMAMMVLFRMLFIAYAEDKDLLPYKFNALYKARSLKVKAQELLKLQLDNTPFDRSTSYWEEVSLLCRAVDEGKAEWGVPAYDGGLFSRDKDVSPLGALLDKLTLPNTVFGQVLRDLLIIQSPEGWGPVDFRSLNVGEFGTIYQGLLESELAIAETNLTVDEKGFYRPCRRGEEPFVKESHIYLHNRSGARKATGTYFTKDFAVAHLLDQALEPPLHDHCGRIDALDDEAAADAFFDFRVADIAMGSAHFLVAAVDRIERAFTSYLAKRPLPGARRELLKLRAASEQSLGSLAEAVEIEDTQLLRRLIARRCIYGVDLNPVAVDLARLSLWIHTFVPGLPLSLLDRNLVVGNSLVGIGQLSEIEDKAREDGLEFFSGGPLTLVEDAVEPLKRLARLADATLTEVARAREVYNEARQAAAPAAALCNIVTAARITRTSLEGNRRELDLKNWDKTKRSIIGSKFHESANQTLGGLLSFHFPMAFPEVFLRNRPGFDVIVGNPPWEKVRVEEHEFWGRHAPGLRGLRKAERDRLTTTLRKKRPDLVELWEQERTESEKLRDAIRDLPGMNTGHPDLFRAFAWRFVQLAVQDGGAVGVVLPGDTFKIAGGTDVREQLVAACSDIAPQMLTNKAGWVFDGVHPQKLIAFVTGTVKRGSVTTFHLTPEFHNRPSWNSRDPKDSKAVPLETLREYSPTLVVPLLPRTDSFKLIEQFMKLPTLISHPAIRVRRVYADFETSKHDKKYWHDDKQPGDWPVYAGESFDIWEPDTGAYYAFTNANTIQEAAHAKSLRAPRGSPYADLPEMWRQKPQNHPIHSPRIAFRDVTNRTNSRTLVVALVPPNIVTVQTAPWVLWREPTHLKTHEAFLVGVMSSLPLDWWCRRFIEGHADQESFNCLRIPDPRRCTKLVERVVALAGRLAAVDERFAEWALGVGVDCGALDATMKRDHVHELDALVAHLYNFTEAQLVHIFQTFHEGWDYADRLEATLKHFNAWKKRLP